MDQQIKARTQTRDVGQSYTRVRKKREDKKNEQHNYEQRVTIKLYME